MRGKRGLAGRNAGCCANCAALIRSRYPPEKTAQQKGAVRLRILTIQAKLRRVAPEGFQRDRSLPIASRDEGRRSVGIAKEQLAVTIAIPGPIGKPFDGVEIAEPRAGAVWFFYRKGLPEDQSGSPADEAAFSCSQIERSYALTDRQVTLRSLTAFPSDRFAIRERWGISSPKPLAWGPVPRPLPRFARFQAAMRSFPAARRPSARRPRLRAGPRRRYAPQA